MEKKNQSLTQKFVGVLSYLHSVRYIALQLRLCLVALDAGHNLLVLAFRFFECKRHSSQGHCENKSYLGLCQNPWYEPVAVSCRNLLRTSLLKTWSDLEAGNELQSGLWQLLSLCWLQSRFIKNILCWNLLIGWCKKHPSLMWIWEYCTLHLLDVFGKQVQSTAEAVISNPQFRPTRPKSEPSQRSRWFGDWRGPSDIGHRENSCRSCGSFFKLDHLLTKKKRFFAASFAWQSSSTVENPQLLPEVKKKDSSQFFHNFVWPLKTKTDIFHKCIFHHFITNLTSAYPHLTGTVEADVMGIVVSVDAHAHIPCFAGPKMCESQLKETSSKCYVSKRVKKNQRPNQPRCGSLNCWWRWCPRFWQDGKTGVKEKKKESIWRYQDILPRLQTSSDHIFRPWNIFRWFSPRHLFKKSTAALCRSIFSRAKTFLMNNQWSRLGTQRASLCRLQDLIVSSLFHLFRCCSQQPHLTQRYNLYFWSPTFRWDFTYSNISWFSLPNAMTPTNKKTSLPASKPSCKHCTLAVHPGPKAWYAAWYKQAIRSRVQVSSQLPCDYRTKRGARKGPPRQKWCFSRCFFNST